MVKRERDAAGLYNFLLCGERKFSGKKDDLVPCPLNMISRQENVTIRLWFKTRSSGVILWVMDTRDYKVTVALYAGADGHLYGQFANGYVKPMASSGLVDDGQWHYAALMTDGLTQHLYLDGRMEGNLHDSKIIRAAAPRVMIGGGIVPAWPQAPAGLFLFSGSIADVVVESRMLAPKELKERMLEQPGRTCGEVIYHW